MASSSYVDQTAGAVEHCLAMAQEHPPLADKYYKPMADACQAKLWHQLTLKVLEFLYDPETAKILDQSSSPAHSSFLALYDKVVMAVDTKLNPLALARMASAVATALAPHDLHAAKAVLENLLTKQEQLGVNPTIFVQSKLSLLTLESLLQTTPAPGSPQEQERQELLQGIYKVLTENEAKLRQQIMVVSQGDQMDQALVHAAHYQQGMMYYKIVGPPEAFYNQAMNFLNYAPPPIKAKDSSTTTTQTDFYQYHQYHQLAVDLCLAALTGDGVYNLGQVEQTPVLTLLQDTPDAWLVELLQACAAGNVVEFAQVSNKYAAQIAQQPALVHRAAAVQEKLTLLALVRMVFEKASGERTLTLQEIAERLQVTEDQVEWVVMRAFSVHLLEGSIDQVEQTVQITWVLPRVLNAGQLGDLGKRFGEWAVKVSETKEYMVEQTSTFA